MLCRDYNHYVYTDTKENYLYIDYIDTGLKTVKTIKDYLRL